MKFSKLNTWFNSVVANEVKQSSGSKLVSYGMRDITLNDRIASRARKNGILVFIIQ